MKYKIFIKDIQKAVVEVEAKDINSAKIKAVADYLTDEDNIELLDWDVSADIMHEYKEQR